MKNIKFIYILIGLFCIVEIFAAAPKTVKVVGRVLDDKGNPLSGITISLQEKDTQAKTDADGSFELNATNNDILTINETGYFVIKEKVASSLTPVLKLFKMKYKEERILNWGFGNTNERVTTSCISQIDESTIRTNSVTSLEQAMNGTLTGLYSTKNGGEKFGVRNFNFLIRGIATTANSSPIILIDNMESSLDMIDFNEIASVSVLKDASALAIYGMRGANGAILISTKHGSELTHGFEINVSSGVQSAVKIADRLNSSQYTTLYNEALVNDGRSAIYDPSKYDGTQSANLYPDNDLKKTFLSDLSPYQYYNFKAHGGNAIAQYFVSAAYLNQNGLFVNNSGYSGNFQNSRMDKFNFRTNIDVNVNNSLKCSVSIGALIDNNQSANYGSDALTNNNSLLNYIINQPANASPLLNENGSLGGTAQYKVNPIGVFFKSGVRSDERRMLNSKVSAKQDLSFLLKGLSAEAFYGFETYNQQYLTISSQYAVFAQNTDNTYTQFGTDDSKRVRSSGLSGDFSKYTQWGGRLDYIKQWNNNSMKLLYLFNQSIESVAGDTPDYIYMGQSVRGEFGFQNKLFFDATVTNQGNNNYDKGKRMGWFYAAGASYIIAENSQNSLSYLKVRANYGLLGNDQTGGSRFAYRQTWSYGASGSGYAFGSPNAWAGGTFSNALGNAGATWEKSQKFNIGVDAELFNKLSLSVDYFKEHRSDILVPASFFPQFMGITMQPVNLGIVENQGFELSANYKATIGMVQLNLGGNVTYAENKIIDLKELDYQYPWQFRKGQSIDTYFGFQTNGIYATNNELTNAPVSSFGIPTIGNLKYVNQNATDDNVIDDRDKVALGNSLPRFIFGFNAGLKYGGFDMNAQFEGASKFSVMVIPSTFSPYTFENRWNPTLGQTAFPRVSIASVYDKQTSDFWQQDASFLRIGDIELGYTIPASIIQKIKLKQVRFYLKGNNLYTFSNIREGRDPEAVSAGFSQYPLLRSYVAGFSINF